MSSLCDRMDYSPPGSSVHGILRGRTLEWVLTPSSRGGLPHPGIEPTSLLSPALADEFFITEPPGKPFMFTPEFKKSSTVSTSSSPAPRHPPKQAPTPRGHLRCSPQGHSTPLQLGLKSWRLLILLLSESELLPRGSLAPHPQSLLITPAAHLSMAVIPVAQFLTSS